MNFKDTPKPHGVHFDKSGKADVVVWAPEKEQVDVLINSDRKLSLGKEEDGYWWLNTDAISPGDTYQFILDGEDPLPDPATLYQPEGVHGPSGAFDLKAFKWSDSAWQNPQLKDYIIYELHAGTFTDEGTFISMIEKLDYLTELGVNAIEIMPVSQFAGNRNWGYDGVFPYSVQDTYGGPAALQKLVNACHEKGIAVIMDVVYNHMGPEGNVLSQYGPYFTDKYNTPWGDAMNFDDKWSDGVRAYFVDNAIMWFRDFHIDALRMDAVHAIKDFSPKHLLAEISEATRKLAADGGGEHYLIVEMDLNDTRYIKSAEEGGYGMHGQWIDEFHHALRVSSGQEKSGYYSDFDPITSLAKSYRDAYVYDGIYSEHRKRKFGVKADGFSGDHFVVFSQNHDHIGNRMLGERTSQLVSFEMQKLLAGAVMASPYVPLLFMGEEWAETNPFQYFVSHTDPELAEAVRKGRKKEFAEFHLEGEAPDPMAEDTFNKSKVQWDLLDKAPHQTMLAYYKELIRLRKSNAVLGDCNRDGVTVFEYPEMESIVVQRVSGDITSAILLNFSKSEQSIKLLEGIENWKKWIASSDTKWGGKVELDVEIAGSEMKLPAESFAIYASATNS